MRVSTPPRPDITHLLHPCVPCGFCAAFYRGSDPWPRSVFTDLAKRLDQSPYCHAELNFSDGWSASSTGMDEPKGVRFKPICYSRGPQAWDFIEVDPALEPAARAWYEAHEGEGYDLVGQLRFLSGLFAYVNDPKRWFCSESVAAALERINPGRWGPGGMAEEIREWRAPRPLDLDEVFPTPEQRSSDAAK